MCHLADECMRCNGMQDGGPREAPRDSDVVLLRHTHAKLRDAESVDEARFVTIRRYCAG